MLLKGLYHNFHLRIAVFVLLTIAGTYLALRQEWVWFVPVLSIWAFLLRLILLSDKRNAQKVAFMFDAIDNSDYAFRYATRGRSSNDKLVSESLNRITQILFQAKADAAQKEKYYELIMNCVNTGIIVLDDNGVIYQTNNEALRLLGLAVFTNVQQLARIDENLKAVIQNIQPGDKHQISFANERGNVHLSIRVSEMTLQDKHVRILAINDINSELDDKEIDSWIRLTRVLTHEIMNSVTPITSLSDTLLSLHQNADDEIRNGLEVISTTGKSLISFVESYRKFTHIPTPEPTLFYVQKFAERMVKLARHHTDFPNITINVSVEPSDLIVYADENLISQVVLNLLKNAMWQLLVVTIGCILWDLCTGWHGWSVNYVLPGVCIIIQISMMIISKIQSHSPREYMIYYVMAAGYGILLPFILLLTKVITFTAPAVVCVGFSFLFLLALILFKGREFKEEMHKKLHV